MATAEMLERKLTALAKKKTHETIPYSFGWRYNDLTAGMLMNMIALFIERPQIFSRSSLQIVIYKRRAVLRKFINLFCFFCFFFIRSVQLASEKSCRVLKNECLCASMSTCWSRLRWKKTGWNLRIPDKRKYH